MKLFFLLLFCNIITNCYSQKDTINTKLEKELIKKGSLIRKETINIGEITSFAGPSVTVQVISVTDLTADINTKGVRVKAGEDNSYLDVEEVESLIYSLNKLQKLIKENTPETYNEFKYISNSDFQVFIYNSKKDWVFGVQTSSYGSRGTVYFQKRVPEALEKFTQLIIKAKKELK